MSDGAARTDTFGVILAGGRGTRMGGRDKGQLLLAGRPLLEHVAGRLLPQCHGVVLNANGGVGAGPLPVVADDLPDYPGPLAGILAGMDFVAAHHPAVEWLVSVAVDTPFVPRDLVMRLHGARLAADAAIACATSGGRRHPTMALWPVRLRGELRRALAEEGLRKLGLFQDRHGLALAPWVDEPVDPFFNINTAEDLARAEAVLALTEAP